MDNNFQLTKSSTCKPSYVHVLTFKMTYEVRTHNNHIDDI
jgi:hypothetical protein